MNNKYISSIWNFSDTKDPIIYAQNNLLRWYGKLPYQLVDRLIDLYSDKKDTILANFSGSGTIALECLRNHRNCIAIDSNPLSILIGKVKTTPINFNKERFKIYFENNLKMTKHPASNDIEKKWFRINDLSLLKNIWHLINKYPCSKDEKDLLILVFASIIKKSSLVDSRCVNHIVINKEKNIGDIKSIFIKKLLDTANTIHTLNSISNKNLINISRGDARKLNHIKNNSIDLIISHPPYLGNVDYTNINKLENYFLFKEINDIRDKDISSNSLDSYLSNICKVVDESYRVIKKGKYFCFIIGDNRQNGNIIPTFSHIIQYGTKHGFVLKDIFIWILNQKAGMNVKRHGNHIDHNYILVFCKH